MKKVDQNSSGKRARSQALGSVGQRSAGFSLVELLIVVTILLVLMALALPRLFAARESAQQAAAVAFLRKLHAAQEQHYIVYGSYAQTFAQLDGLTASSNLPSQPELILAQLYPRRASVPPTMAFLMAPSLNGDGNQAFHAGNPPPGKGPDQNSSGGSAPTGDAPSSGGGSAPSSGSGAADSSSGSGSSGSGSSGSGSSDSGSGGSGSGGAGSGSGGNWSNADRFTWQGYEFRLERPTPHTWRCLAMPVQDERGNNHYFADQSGTIRREFGRPASAQSAPL